ncbi:hypothetical protein [Dyadobacter fanqingshengii]|uniref:Uncharacterized protein n=1 Tax=Dyadobacter fanqingshengii TaxID=2906443 RepID=A0A9X1P5E3_9BACT|nr:hypothetical protein [Dyadobacter fanqingshengii]MCF0038726.1 hypothetical protein [Dyadobacter fanqingshengii]USJ34442.1 hypothetical protein NFI81_17210 [Dyadobacter fanqingshengii]
MKTNRLIFVIAALIAALNSCKQRDITKDSPLITVTSPLRDQDLMDSTAFNVEAIIEPKNASVIRYYIRILDSERQPVFEKKVDCNCIGEKRVNVKQAVEYDVNQTTNLLLRLSATLDDMTNIQEEVPFKMVNVKK